MNKRLAAAIFLTMVMCACQSNYPLPPLPPPGPVTTAEDAIRIAINVCAPRERVMSEWMAHLEGDRWIVELSLRLRFIGPTAQIRAQDGTVLECGERVFIT